MASAVSADSEHPRAAEEPTASLLPQQDKRLAVQAYEQVLDLIMGGTLRPGMLIQERRLAEHLNMSRTPLRDALLMLEGEGLLARHGPKGLQVKRLDLEDFLENLAIRRLLEPDAARSAAGRIDPAILSDLARRLGALLAAASAGSVQADRAVVRGIDDDLHGAISAAAGNRTMAGLISSLRRQTQMFDLRSVPERLEATCREHLAVVDALAGRDGDGAADAMRVHLDGVRQSIIARLAGG